MTFNYSIPPKEPYVEPTISRFHAVMIFYHANIDRLGMVQAHDVITKNFPNSIPVKKFGEFLKGWFGNRTIFDINKSTLEWGSNKYPYEL